MRMQLRTDKWREAIVAAVLVPSLAALLSTSAAMQGTTSKPVDLPNGPAKPGFDIARFRNAGNGTFQTFFVAKTESLRDALKQGRVTEDTRLLVTDTAAGKLALILDQMAFHHVAEGRAGNKDWLATF